MSARSIWSFVCICTCVLQCSSASRSQARPSNMDVIFMSTCSIPLFTKFVKQLEWPYLHIYHNLPVQWWCTISYSAQHSSNVEIEPAKLSQKLEQAFIVLMGSQKGAEIHMSVLLRSSLNTNNPRALGWHVADFFSIVAIFWETGVLITALFVVFCFVPLCMVRQKDSVQLQGIVRVRERICWSHSSHHFWRKVVCYNGRMAGVLQPDFCGLHDLGHPLIFLFNPLRVFQCNMCCIGTRCWNT